MFILACTNSDPPMESLRATLDTFTLAAHNSSVEHDDDDDDDDDDDGRSQRNRTTGEAAAAAASGNIEDEDDATDTSMNAPEALSNMQLCSVTCRYRGRGEGEVAAAPKLWNGITRPAGEDTRAT